MTVTIELIESRHSFHIHELISDPEIAKTSDIPHPLPLEEASAWIERMKALREQGRVLTFAILVHSRVVGVCQLGNRDRTISDSGELGFFTGKAFWGRGYATEGSRLLLMLCQLKLPCLEYRSDTSLEKAWLYIYPYGFAAPRQQIPPNRTIPILDFN
jgi:RimJ/RimL family protein N-acetyltransferase